MIGPAVHNKTECHICGGAPSQPHKRIVGGKIVEMCVGPIHDGHLIRISNEGAWYYRAEAKAIRRQERLGRLGR